jgi:ribosomal protein L11 methyltransferase
VATKEIESLHTLVSEWPEFLGIQELNSQDKDMFSVPEGLEFQEFGSEACFKFEKHLNTQSRSYEHLKLYLNCDKTLLAHFINSLKKWSESVEYEEIRTEDYIENYQKSVRGQSIGNSIWVGPPWDKPASNIRWPYFIEPGLGFGTGEHPTTQLCLEFIEELSPTHDFQNILDLGCGSGILCLACLDLFPHALISASDLDPQCEFELEKNLKLNHKKASSVRAYFGKQSGLSYIRSQSIAPFDFIISNIYSNVLCELFDDIFKSLEKNAYWLLSGILEGNGEDAVKNLASKKMHLIERRSMRHPIHLDEQWIAMLWKKE